MKPSVFLDQFVDLAPGQRGLLWEYHRLTTRALSISAEEIDRLARIWEVAEQDPVLSQWLSLIDFLYANVPFTYEAGDDDRRAYLSEYIELLTDEKHLCSDTHLSAASDGVDGCVKQSEHYQALLSPDGSGYIVKPIQEADLIDSGG